MADTPGLTVRDATPDEVALRAATEKLLEDLEERSKAGLTAILGQATSVATMFGFFVLLPKEMTARIVLSWPFWMAVGLVIVSFSATLVGLWATNQSTLPRLSDPAETRRFWTRRIKWRRAWQWVALVALLLATIAFASSALVARAVDTAGSILLTPTPGSTESPATVLAKVSVVNLDSDHRLLICMRDPESATTLNESTVGSDGTHELSGIVPTDGTTVVVDAWELSVGDERDCQTDAGSPVASATKVASASLTIVRAPAAPTAEESPSASVTLSALATSSRDLVAVVAKVDISGLPSGNAVVVCIQDKGRVVATSSAVSDGVKRIRSLVPRSTRGVKVVAYLVDEPQEACEGNVLGSAFLVAR